METYNNFHDEDICLDKSEFHKSNTCLPCTTETFIVCALSFLSFIIANVHDDALSSIPLTKLDRYKIKHTKLGAVTHRRTMLNLNLMSSNKIIL